MSGWRLISTSLSVGAAAGVLYLSYAVGKFGFVKKLSRGKRLFRWLISLALIGAVFGLFSLTMTYINAVIVLLHGVLFFLLFGLITRIIKAIRKKDFKLYWQGVLAVSGTAVCLITGYLLCHIVWRTDYSLTTDKDIGTLKIVMFADSHLDAVFDGKGFAEHIETIKQQEPDIVLIAGDFIDSGSSRESLAAACEALGTVDAKYGVWFSYGNHDKGRRGGSDFSGDELRNELEKNGVHILADESELIDGRFYLIGRRDASENGRAEIERLVSSLDREKYMIVLDHQPNDYDNEAAAGVDLVLSGHTHGGQLFPANYVGEWLGMNDRTYGHERRENTDFIVTSGIADWNIKFKTGTRSEYVFITVEQQ